MSDPKSNIDNDILDLDDIVSDDDDLQSLYDDAELADLDGLEDLESEEVIAVSKESSSSERLWMILTLLAFGLALLSTLLLSPAVSSQKQRVDQVSEVVNKINLTTTSAAQALTEVGGRYEPLKENIAGTEDAINRLVTPDGMSEKIAGALFGNGEANSAVTEQWSAYKAATQQFLANEGDVQEVKQRLQALTGRLTKVVGDSVGFVEAVAREGRNKDTGASKDKYLFLTSEASNLNGILGRLSTTLRGYFLPESNLPQLADAQNGLMVRLQETLNRIVSNSSTVVATAAEPLRAQYADLETRVLEIGDRAAALTESRASLQSVRDQGATLAQSVQAASNQGLTGRLNQLAILLPLLLALFGVFSLWRYSQAQTSELVAHDAGLEETLADQQESILKLLDEMSALADGDLTVEAEVTDQITGAIADSVNFAVIEMRELVSQINRASIQVANESELAVSNAQSVSQSNMTQAEQISAAAALMQEVTAGMRQMSEQANSSSDMASESLKAAEQGAQAVRDTISGMEDMREQIQDTSKRIKRLGESSQRIGDIVALIDDIAEQTNILSLNAAIQASMAGEAGRGFAVVSDEVQSLAERSTEATKKIAELVTTIQNDTNDAVLSMEKATQQVVSGTKVADSAGNALAEIERVSQTLSALVQGISAGSNQQAETVTRVSEQVTQVSDSSTETSRKAQESANSIAKLLELAKDLETSVSRFKLPAN
ncbi:methyl-accepting chemotaxis protein [Arenicella xantha]|uniref:Twitching motility protein PilJ n=1 Tax=Arenicella xantha TaxID=644221 RepID=A0A395JP37_9GAMM|nr:methyl-accepting chemotaxis protein [Arenicella xantha]RBP53267.1 twitching motility protein PilJ [Arenicella xantha]